MAARLSGAYPAPVDETSTGAHERSHQIGEVAAQLHLSLRTLRYWEEVGLIEPTGRRPGGHRAYTDEDVDRIRLIRAMKAADFHIDELRELVGLVAAVRAGDAAAVTPLHAYVRRVRERCEITRARVAEAEGAALELEALLDAQG